MQVDESVLPGEDPAAYVSRLAGSKARAASLEARPKAVVIAADTTVVDQGEILGKPAGALEAIALLRRLRGHSHHVFTAIAVARGDELLIDLAVTEVPMREYTEEELQAYVASGDPFDKAGGYAIQHQKFHPVGELQGCYANVVGLPLCHLVRTLARLGIPPRDDVPRACQRHLHYQCPVFQQVLRGEG